MNDYQKAYEAENIRRVVVKVNSKTMPDIAQKLSEVKPQTYILDLIRKDIAAQK